MFLQMLALNLLTRLNGMVTAHISIYLPRRTLTISFVWFLSWLTPPSVRI